MNTHRGKKDKTNGDLSKTKPPQIRSGGDAVLPARRSPQRLKAKAPPSVDQVDEASRGSFPCSDAPGYGHA
jgi:hypothetical protein